MRRFNPLEIGSTFKTEAPLHLMNSRHTKKFQSPRNRVNIQNADYHQRPGPLLSQHRFQSPRNRVNIQNQFLGKRGWLEKKLVSIP